MSYKVMFVLNALIAVVVGLALLFVPAIGLDQFGTEKYESTVFITRLYGLAAFTIGLLLWFAKNIPDANIQKQLGVVMFVSSLIGLVVSIIGVSPASGVIRVNSWIPIVVFAVSTLGYGFILFLKPRMKE